MAAVVNLIIGEKYRKASNFKSFTDSNSTFQTLKALKIFLSGFQY